MTIIEPVEYEWLACDAPDDVAAWKASTKYVKGQEVQYGSRVYKVAKDLTSSTTPDKDINNYVDFGAINSHAFCDEMLSSQSIKKGENEISYMELSVDVKSEIDCISFINLNAYKIEFLNFDFREVNDWYEYFFKEWGFSALKRSVNNWWEYFYSKIEIKREKNIHLPFRYKGRLDIRIYATDGFAGLGMLIVGNNFYIGETLRGAGVGAISYTKKITDDWGNSIIRKGKTAKKNQYEVVIDTNRIDAISNALNSSMERGLCVFVGDSRDDDGYDALSVTGILSEFDIAISTLDKSELTIGVEGVI